MKHALTLFLYLTLFSSAHMTYAQSTVRVPEFSNHQTNVWKTIIYPRKNLGMHRHDYDRVLVALNNGQLKITNDKGEVHYFKLKKNQAYYLPKDPINELHKDESMSKHPITVMVIELKNNPEAKLPA